MTEETHDADGAPGDPEGGTADHGARRAIERAQEIDALLKPQGGGRMFLQRNGKTLALVVLVALLSPSISRFLEQNRGVVLELRDGEMLVQPAQTLPRWVDDVGAKPGDMVAKPRWSRAWSVVAAEPTDRPAVALFERYTAEYEGTAVEIMSAAQPGMAAVAIETHDGARLVVSVWSPPVWLKPGAHLKKRRGTWEPEITAP